MAVTTAFPELGNSVGRSLGPGRELVDPEIFIRPVVAAASAKTFTGHFRRPGWLLFAVTVL